jgi:hypothetical protein
VEKEPAGYWDDVANQREHFLLVQKELGISKPDDWYNVTLKQVLPFGTKSVLYPVVICIIIAYNIQKSAWLVPE